MANLHLENHFIQRKRGDEVERERLGRRRMVRRRGNIAGCHDEEAGE